MIPTPVPQQRPMSGSNPIPPYQNPAVAPNQQYPNSGQGYQSPAPVYQNPVATPKPAYQNPSSGAAFPQQPVPQPNYAQQSKQQPVYTAPERGSSQIGWIIAGTTVALVLIIVAVTVILYNR